jgi:hypothetical protein
MIFLKICKTSSEFLNHEMIKISERIPEKKQKLQVKLILSPWYGCDSAIVISLKPKVHLLSTHGKER